MNQALRLRAALVSALVVFSGARASSEALSDALVRAHQDHPQLNAERTRQHVALEGLNTLRDPTIADTRLNLAKRDRVVATSTLPAAIGRLDHNRLMLGTPDYDPLLHDIQVRDAWRGLRTPTGQ